MENPKMPSWPRFPRAPITEALLDIRAKLPPSIDMIRLGTFYEIVKAQYPQKRERRSWQGALEMKLGGPAVVQQSGGPDGYLFISQDGRQIVQARLDGFTVNRLRPYDRWASLRDEAKSQWKHYLQVATPELVTRVALRYLNRLELPQPIRDFKEYILTVPEIAPDLPQGLATFFMQLVVPSARLNCTAMINETMEAPTEKVLPFILDIDVFREAAFEPNGDDLWQAFEELREYKNDIFFKSITRKTEELFA
ncbi:MAG: TIGR04255 family protein [Deltaproteobacteria bacterium]|nr:TIGR04255 family protein [Deltaproteobacteria bacterium]